MKPPSVPLCEYTLPLSEAWVLTWAPDPPGTEKSPPPPPTHFPFPPPSFHLDQTQVQIGDSNTLVKAGGPQSLRQPALYMHQGGSILNLHTLLPPLGLYVTAGYQVAAEDRQ